MPTLADIYSAADSFKRRLADAAMNPGASLQQMLSQASENLAERRARDNATWNQVHGDPTHPLRVTDPQALQQEYQNAMDLVSFAPVGMTVWHGSPYKFTKFDPSKIGTGEGAQAYGHGLYVAENPSVAKEYAANVKDLDSIQSYNQRLKKLSKAMEEDSVYPGAYRKFKSEKGQKAAEEYDSLMEMRNQKATDKGNLYKIDLPDEHIEKMLDWDKPLSEQHPEVKKALSKIDDDFINQTLKTKPIYNEKGDYWSYLGNTYSSKREALEDATPQMLVHGARGGFGSPKEVSEKLRQVGIPGIKYFDQMSRGAGKGSRNFVVFPGNEHLLQIQDINGNPIK